MTKELSPEDFEMLTGIVAVTAASERFAIAKEIQEKHSYSNEVIMKVLGASLISELAGHIFTYVRDDVRDDYINSLGNVLREVIGEEEAKTATKQ